MTLFGRFESFPSWGQDKTTLKGDPPLDRGRRPSVRLQRPAPIASERRPVGGPVTSRLRGPSQCPWNVHVRNRTRSSESATPNSHCSRSHSISSCALSGYLVPHEVNKADGLSVSRGVIYILFSPRLPPFEGTLDQPGPLRHLLLGPYSGLFLGR